MVKKLQQFWVLFEHTFAEKNFEKAEEKSKHAFNLNYKMNESDQEFYNKAIKKLNTASTLLSNIKKQYKIVSINPWQKE